MWSASRRSAVIAQQLYGTAIYLASPRFLPGRREDWRSPITGPAGDSHHRMWTTWFGDFDEVAAHHPLDKEQTDIALLLLRDGRPRGFVKCRVDWNAEFESKTMTAVKDAVTFFVPEVIGVFADSGWTSMGAAPLPSGIHSARVRTPVDEIADEISELLGRSREPIGPGMRWMHGEMGPWNLRGRRGRTPVLFDWETASAGPVGADVVFHTVASLALGIKQVKTDISPFAEARSYWEAEIPKKFGRGRRDARLAQDMIEILRRAA